MSIETFIKGIFITIAFGFFVFTGGCALSAAIPCIFSRCIDFGGLVIIVGVFFAFISAFFLLWGLKSTSLPFKVLRAVFTLFSVLMSITICTMFYYTIVGILSMNDVDASGVAIAAGYIGVLVLFSVLPVKATIKMYKSQALSEQNESEKG